MLSPIFIISMNDQCTWENKKLEIILVILVVGLKFYEIFAICVLIYTAFGLIAHF
jgi:hypothetical protein